MNKQIPLFRKQAVEAKNSINSSNISVSIPLGMRHFFFLLCAISFVFFMFSIVTEIRRKITVSGVIMPKQGFIELKALDAGVISELHVSNTQIVTKGEFILSVSNHQYTAGGDSFEKEHISLLQRQIELLVDEEKRLEVDLKNYLDFLSTQVSIEKKEKNINQSKLHIASQKHAILSNEVEQAKKLEASYTISSKEWKAMVQKALDSEEHLRQLEISILINDSKLNELRYEQSAKTITTKRKDSERKSKIESLKKEILLVKNRFGYTMKAPTNGVVQFHDLNTGASINKGDILLYIFPQQPEYIAQLYAFDNVIGMLEPNMEANLRLDGYPSEYYGVINSKIIEVSTTPNSRKNLVDIDSNASTIYTVRAELETQFIVKDDKQFHLQPGMSFSADVWLEKRSLAFWIFEPFIKIKNRI